MSFTTDAVSIRDDTRNDAAPTLSDLHDRLDSLWISYLRHLDAYTTAQKTLQQHMRSGFFSLSRANFNARPGMRYGRDYFHDRAVAMRRVEVTQDDDQGSDGRLRLSVVKRLSVSDDERNDDAAEKDGPTREGLQQPSPPATPDFGDDQTKTASDQYTGNLDATEEKYDGSEAKQAKSKLPLEADPLRWYGILVPQELRSAQASFSSAVDEGIAGAVNASRAMREVEIEIRKLRKEIRRAEKAAKD